MTASSISAGVSKGRVCCGITAQSKESASSFGSRSLTNGRADAVDGLFGPMETGDITKFTFANEFAYFRYRCSMCHRLPWTFLNIPSFWTVPLELSNRCP
ncbi:hypothetical protein CEXT_247401 [Caerostris extrusa]|uniref:Uncharacterized protein n=1 Tax=Caerostris extrusa TaxID=172846 RepID=A0AAV4PBA6_CAEEX|nr:hypothetical protein CEXT_247401 [Caerostris extrusa]